MTRRQKLAICVVATAFTLAVGIGMFVAITPPSLASLERKLEQVRNGMTYPEVVAIMGTDYDGEPRVARPYILWCGARGAVASVQFDGGDRVSGKKIFDMSR
jgi:hypothetical protein